MYFMLYYSEYNQYIYCFKAVSQEPKSNFLKLLAQLLIYIFKGSRMAYIKLYQGSFIVVQMMRRHLENQDIKPIIKDESESARLAGFGVSDIGIQQLFVHESEVPNATKIINVALGQMRL